MIMATNGNDDDTDPTMEYNAVSGILYVTVDSRLLYTQKFNKHIKLKIVFDKERVVKGENHEAMDKNFETEHTPNDDLCEEQDFHALLANVVSAETCDTEINDAANSYQIVIEDSSSNCKSQDWSYNCEEKTNSKSLNLNKTDMISQDSKINSNARLSSNKRSNQNEGKRRNISSKNSDQSVPCKEKKKGPDGQRQAIEGVQCPYCFKSFKNRRECLRHRYVERQHRFPCLKCGKILPYEAYLLVHMDEHEKLESAQTANKSYPSFKLRRKARTKCCVCGLFMSGSQIMRHVMIHTGEQVYKCCVCEKLFRNITHYKNHMSTHRNSDRGTRIHCKACNLYFCSRAELCKHQLSHAFPCHLCGEVFTNRTGRKYHYKNFHKGDFLKLKCPKCERLYSCETELKNHLTYHRTRRKVQCPNCGLLVFRLPSHMARIHGKKLDGSNVTENTFVCDKCPKQFKMKQQLNRHLAIHSGERLYKCAECPKRFVFSGGLAKHMKTHLPDKPYVCEICGKGCNQRGNLKVHMNVHKGYSISFVKKELPIS